MKFTAALVALVIVTAASAQPETPAHWYVQAGAGYAYGEGRLAVIVRDWS
jgi:hypothetical protein